MTQEADFTIIFAPEVIDHLRAIDKKFHSLIRETIFEQLTYTPLEVTRNRKPLEQPAPFGANWELRFGNKNCFRVFYEVDTVDQIVLILAIGIKERERLLVSGEVFEI